MTERLPIGRECLDGLVGFLEVFEDPTFTFGQWSTPSSTDSGVISIPMFEFSEAGADFLDAVYKLGWVRSDFNWINWKSTPEAEQLKHDADALADATADQIAKLLTTLVRSERFCEGALASAFQSGFLTDILRRARVLSSEFQ